MKLKPSNCRRYIGGFTLLELMMCMAIMLVMSVVLFAKYPETVKRTTLANVANSAALMVHEAQVRGSAIDSANSSLGGYGVYVLLSQPDRIVLFGDRVNGTLSPYQMNVGDGLYQTTPEDETKTTIKFPDGYRITKLCVGNIFPAAGGCNGSSTPPISSLTVSFTRPSPLPNIYLNGASSTVPGMCVEFRSSQLGSGYARSVQVFTSGVVRSVNAGCQ